VINLAIKCKKKLLDLTDKDFQKDRFARVVLKKSGKSIEELCRRTEDSIKEKINRDDIMLGYLPYIIHLVRTPKNTHYFAYMTSGFNAVTNSYALEMLEKLEKFIDLSDFQNLASEDYFDPSNVQARNRDIYQYLDGVASNDEAMKQEAEARRLLRNMVELYEDDNLENLKFRISELKSYFKTQYPGKKDIPIVQRLKGMIREWEVELLWAHLGFNCSNVIHMRLGFYKGDIFTEEPQINRDVRPLVNLLLT